MTGGTSAFNGTEAVLGDVLDINRVGGVDQGRKQRLDRQAGCQVEVAVFEVAQARGEAVAEEGHEPEDVVGGAAGIAQMRRLAGGRGNGPYWSETWV
jgi:hypothetical protein